MHGVKRLFAWMIPRFDRDALQRLAHQPAQARPLERHARRARHRRHLPASIEVRSGDAAGAAQGARSPPGRRRAPARLRREHVRPAGGRDAAHARRRARARQPDRHAVVPEGRGHGCSRRTPTSRSRSRSRPPTSRSTGAARFRPSARRSSTSACRWRSSAVRGRADEIAAARRALGIPAGAFAIGTVTRLMPSKGNEYLVDAARQVLDALPSARIYIVGEGELQADARGAGASARSSATGWCSPGSGAMWRRRCRRSTSSCFRRSGRARR